MRFAHLASKRKMMHTPPMRTTLTLEDDAYEIAQLCAYGKGVSLGAAVSELVRRGQQAYEVEQTRPFEEQGGLVLAETGIYTFPPSNRVITDAMVRAALEEED